ncbi:acyl-CoA dehydrogenase family protein [Pseudonocardia halophobica]|nr:acyl-CoA dehydrogenase family protein [Pseudonocardia halophobica]
MDQHDVDGPVVVDHEGAVMDNAAEQYRSEIRLWLAENAPADWRTVVPTLDEAAVVEYYQAWARKLHSGGNLVPHWPVEFAGRGLGIAGQVVQQQEFSRADAPRPRPLAISLGHAAATLMEHGDPAQQKLIDHILDGGIFCQGFSEPEAGSDLASLRTRAVRRGDSYIVTGQKTWSSFGRYASWCLLLARTDSEAPKHKGITFFLVDMKSPGLTVRPIKQPTGSAEFAEIFFDEVEVPAAMRIGEEGQGWRIAQTTLTSERAVQLLEMSASLRSSFDRLVAAASVPSAPGALPPVEDPAYRQRFADVALEIEVLAALSAQSLSRVMSYEDLGPLSSLVKIAMSRAVQNFSGLATELGGIEALADLGQPREMGYLSGHHYADHVRSWALTISAGTNEIQRNIIAERVLGLPREPRP